MSAKKNFTESFICYTCDVWHTKSSMQVIAVASKLNLAILLIKSHCDLNGGVINDDQEYNLRNISQTQGIEDFEYEYVIQKVEQNILID